MAIYRCNISIAKRSKGDSSVKSIAYQSAEKIKDNRLGEISDYTRKQGVVYSEIILPENAPQKFKIRSVLWNEVEAIEKQKNSQVARKIEVALPRELNRQEQINLTREYIKNNFVSKGMIADFSLHDNSKGNPHVHIQLTMRSLDIEGRFLPKSEKKYFFDSNGEKIKLANGKFKTWKNNINDWDKKENAILWRKGWADTVNKYLEKNKITERIDHRSYKERGIEKIPNNLSKAVIEMEKRGIRTVKGDLSREIKELNKTLENKELELNKLILLKDKIKENESFFENKAKEIFELKTSYVNLNNEITKINELKNEYYNYNLQLSSFIKTTENYKKNLNQLDEKIKLRKEYKENIKSIFKSKEKKEVEKEIFYLCSLKDKLISNFESQSNFETKEIDNKIYEFKNKKVLAQKNIDKHEIKKIRFDNIQKDISFKYKYEYANLKYNLSDKDFLAVNNLINDYTNKIKIDDFKLALKNNELNKSLNDISIEILEKIKEKSPDLIKDKIQIDINKIHENVKLKNEKDRQLKLTK